MTHGIFVTALNCMDGRTQCPVNDWMKREFGADYVDVITEPGMDRFLSLNSGEKIDSIKEKVLVSVERHHSRAVCVVGHHDCAGNPVSKEEHIKLIKKSVDVVRSWKLPVDVIGLWVGEDWEVERCVSG